MSDPAAVVLVERRRGRAFEDRWLGARVLDLLREGPREAEGAVAMLHPVAAVRDDYEAAWLLDRSRRRLLVYGDPMTGYMGEEEPPRPLPIDELRRRFPGFTVQWLEDCGGLRRYLGEARVELEVPLEALEDEVDALERQLAQPAAPEPRPLPSSQPLATPPPNPSPAKRPRAKGNRVFFVVLALLFVPALLLRLLLLPVRGRASAWMGRRRRRRELLEKRRALRDRLDGVPPAPPRPMGLIALVWFLFLALAGLQDD